VGNEDNKRTKKKGKENFILNPLSFLKLRQKAGQILAPN